MCSRCVLSLLTTNVAILGGGVVLTDQRLVYGWLRIRIGILVYWEKYKGL